ncbi:MAG: glycosyltransferase family 2 protein [Gammaproteobacteria bacterium]
MDQDLKETSTPELSVVIPVYNARQTLEELVRRLLEVLNTTGKSFEIVMVNDGSQDDSWQMLCNLQKQHSDHIVAVELMRNYGQHNAIMCGFRESSGRHLITMDDDLQNPPEEIPLLIEAMEQGDYDLVYGCYEDKKHNRFRNLGSSLAQLFYRRVFKRSNCVSAFRIIKRELMTSILSYSLNFTYLDGLFAWNTQRIGSVYVLHRHRGAGSSGYSLAKLVGLALNLFTNFSLIPLQLVSAAGLLFAIAGFGAGGYFIFQYFMNSIDVPGYASTIVAILILGGVQMLSLGIIGEYLGRLHLNVNRKPQYVRREVRRTNPLINDDRGGGQL